MTPPPVSKPRVARLFRRKKLVVLAQIVAWLVSAFSVMLACSLLGLLFEHTENIIDEVVAQVTVRDLWLAHVTFYTNPGLWPASAHASLWAVLTVADAGGTATLGNWLRQTRLHVTTVWGAIVQSTCTAISFCIPFVVAPAVMWAVRWHRSRQPSRVLPVEEGKEEEEDKEDKEDQEEAEAETGAKLPPGAVPQYVRGFQPWRVKSWLFVAVYVQVAASLLLWILEDLEIAELKGWLALCLAPTGAIMAWDTLRKQRLEFNLSYMSAFVFLYGGIAVMAAIALLMLGTASNDFTRFGALLGFSAFVNLYTWMLKVIARRAQRPERFPDLVSFAVLYEDLFLSVFFLTSQGRWGLYFWAMLAFSWSRLVFVNGGFANYLFGFGLHLLRHRQLWFYRTPRYLAFWAQVHSEYEALDLVSECFLFAIPVLLVFDANVFSPLLGSSCKISLTDCALTNLSAILLQYTVVLLFKLLAHAVVLVLLVRRFVEVNEVRRARGEPKLRVAHEIRAFLSHRVIFHVLTIAMITFYVVNSVRRQDALAD